MCADATYLANWALLTINELFGAQGDLHNTQINKIYLNRLNDVRRSAPNLCSHIQLMVLGFDLNQIGMCVRTIRSRIVIVHVMLIKWEHTKRDKTKNVCLISHQTTITKWANQQRKINWLKHCDFIVDNSALYSFSSFISSCRDARTTEQL